MHNAQTGQILLHRGKERGGEREREREREKEINGKGKRKRNFNIHTAMLSNTHTSDVV